MMIINNSFLKTTGRGILQNNHRFGGGCNSNAFWRSSFHSTRVVRDKVVCVLYPDPMSGYPPKYARSDIPTISKYSDGMTTPSPKSIDFNPGDLLGCVSGELGLRRFLEDRGHELIITADKDGPGCELERHLIDGSTDYVISQPFYPAYMTAERIAMASPTLKSLITAGIGSDHVDLDAAMKNNVDVCEVTFCNSISVR